MNRTLSRRTMLAMAGMGVVGARAVQAQDLATSYTFANGNELVWADPWMGFPVDDATFSLPEAAMVVNPMGAQLVVGYSDETTTLADIVERMFTTWYGDGPRPASVAGGSEQTSFEGTTVQHEFAIYLGTAVGQVTAFFFLLTNGQELKILLSDPPRFGEALTSIQGTVTLNGTPVFEDIDGTELDQVIATAGNVETREYVDELDLLHVKYPSNWHVISQDHLGIELANPAESFVLAIQVHEAMRSSKDEQIAELLLAYFADQGPDARISTPEASDEEFTFATDGQYGLRLMQGMFTSNPERPIFIRASDFEGGRTEAMAVLEEIRAAVLVNDIVPLQGLESHITEITPE